MSEPAVPTNPTPMPPEATRNLLVELLVEELPPKSLKRLGAAFADGIAEGLAKGKFRGRDSVRIRPIYPARSVTEIAPRASSRLNVCAALRIIS